MKTIVLTSFRMEANYSCRKFSIARWQPKGCHFPTLEVLAPFTKRGLPIKEHDDGRYRQLYEDEVLNNTRALNWLKWFVDHMEFDETVVFMCWCNPTRQSTREKLKCHRILVGYWIEENIPDVKVVYADGAETPVWERRKNGKGRDQAEGQGL